MCVCVGQVVQSGEATLMYFHIPLRFAKYGQAMEKVEVEVGGMIFFFFFFSLPQGRKGLFSVWSAVVVVSTDI